MNKKQYDKERYLANKEEIKQRTADYHEKNKEEALKKQREYYNSKKNDPEYKAKRKIHSDNFWKNHKHEIIEIRKRRAEKIENRYSSFKSQAKRHKRKVDLTLEQYREVIKSGLCHYCGETLPTQGSGLDRKDSNKDYSIDNVVSCCKRCNSTFMHWYSYEEKLKLSVVIREISKKRREGGNESNDYRHAS